MASGAQLSPYEIQAHTARRPGLQPWGLLDTGKVARNRLDIQISNNLYFDIKKYTHVNI